MDAVAQACCISWGSGAISDEEATVVDNAIAQRRPKRLVVEVYGTAEVTAAPPFKRHLKFQRRPTPRSPDREASRNRRRRLGGSSALPDTLRHHYTEGQRAALCVVAGEAKVRGQCDLPIDKIAALAGVCRTTVQNALREAAKLGHLTVTLRPVPGRKSLPNLIRIASAEWLTWIKRGVPAHRATGFKAFNPVNPTKNKEEEVRGYRGRKRVSSETDRDRRRPDLGLTSPNAASG